MQGAHAPVLLFLFSPSPFIPLSPFHKSTDALPQPGALFAPVVVLRHVVRAEQVERRGRRLALVGCQFPASFTSHPLVHAAAARCGGL
uniref:Uncharacterized protein n=1 Tax=Rhipicephalus zambeziensis TaxID=60191 RepID=A0A224Y6F4_9ACAR